MQTQQIGKSGPIATKLAYGCMKIARSWEKTLSDAERERMGIESIVAAVEAGYTLFDHADIYGKSQCESIFGKALKADTSLRENMIIATKCGCCPQPVYHWNFSYEHIVKSCEDSLKRLNIDTIDIYQLHRPDYLAQPEEICRAFTDLRDAGKVRHFGLSNHSPSRLAMIQSALSFPLVVNQVRINLLDQDCLDDGTLDQCVEQDITPLAWSPVARGILAGGAPDANDPDLERKQELLKLMDILAAEYGVGRDAIAFAWLLKHPAKIIPIVGTVTPERIRSAVESVDLELDRVHWYQLLVAGRGTRLP
jgi:predicted oxidoreductase